MTISDCLTNFTTPEGVLLFRLDMTEAFRKQNELLTLHKDDDATPGMMACLDEFRTWVKERTGKEISLGQADSLWDGIMTEYTRSKKARNAELTSPDSIPEPMSTA